VQLRNSIPRLLQFGTFHKLFDAIVAPNRSHHDHRNRQADRRLTIGNTMRGLFGAGTETRVPSREQSDRGICSIADCVPRMYPHPFGGLKIEYEMTFTASNEMRAIS
jgi:hypothetical protein